MDTAAVVLKNGCGEQHWYNGYNGSGMGIETAELMHKKYSGGGANSIETAAKLWFYGYSCGGTV